MAENLFPDDPQILLGAECLLCDGLHKLPDLKRVTLDECGILLVEMPFMRWSDSMFSTFEGLVMRSELHPILAHADRYHPDDVERLFHMDVPVQLNVEAFNSLRIKKEYLEWIKDGRVLALGSDIHRTDPGYDLWAKARKKLGSYWEEIMLRTEEFINRY